LSSQVGQKRNYHLEFEAPEAIGTPVVGIPSGSLVEIDLECEVMRNGIFITGELHTQIEGECGRCLEPLTGSISEKFQELFFFQAPEDFDDEIFLMTGDIADIERAVRDAVVLNLPLNPLCQADCLGLCSGCGVKWEELDDDHFHEVIDPRWSDLSGWQA
jgi:uncharacterized protein